MVLFGTGLDIFYSVFLSKSFSLTLAHLSLALLAVDFIRYHYFTDVFRLRLLDLPLESFLICDRIYQNDSSCPFVIGFSNSFKSLLACCIPNLHFDFDSVNGYSLDLEVNAYGGDVRHLIFFVDISEENVSFSNGTVPNDDQLHQVIILLLIFSLIGIHRLNVLNN